LGKAAKGPGNAKNDSVVLEFSQAVVVKNTARGSIDVGVWVLGLAMFLENIRSDLEGLVDKVNDWAGFQVRSAFTELLEGDEARVRIPEDTMSVARNNLSTVKSLPEVCFDIFLSNLIAKFLLHGKLPSQDFLVSQAMKRSSESEKGSRVGKIGVRQSRTNKMSSMRRSISPFMVTMERNVKAQILCQGLVLSVA
jgi:hypothetical protein